MPQPTDPHTAWPASQAAPSPGAIDTCATCGRPIEYLVRPADRQTYGALTGVAGWRHQPAGHAAGDHTRCQPAWCLAARGSEPR